MTERFFGELEDYLVGSTFRSRKVLSQSRVHCPPMGGISGSAQDGADSIVVSGGYEDDVDSGDLIIYTGQGGNDFQTGQQIADQELTRGNKGLVISHEKNLSVRVIRGNRGNTPYSPSEGYRYDGLYKVVRYWDEIGRAGFKIYRFLLSRCDPTPAPWEHVAIASLPIQPDGASGQEISEGYVGAVARSGGSGVSPDAGPRRHGKEYKEGELDLILSLPPTDPHIKLLSKVLERSENAIQIVYKIAFEQGPFGKDAGVQVRKIQAAKKRVGIKVGPK